MADESIFHVLLFKHNLYKESRFYYFHKIFSHHVKKFSINYLSNFEEVVLLMRQIHIVFKIYWDHYRKIDKEYQFLILPLFISNIKIN